MRPVSERELINTDDFVRFANAKGIPIECPVCNHEKNGVTLLTTETGRALSLIDIAIKDAHIDDLRPAHQMVLECMNCGFGRIFRRETVEEWLKDNP